MQLETMTHDLAAIVRSFAGRRVLVFGDLILDRYLYGDAERISPEAPVPVLRAVETREAVGGCANVAVCATALGCRTVCCGVLGRDRHGESLMRLLTEGGVDATPVVCVADRPTTTKTRLVGLAQHRHRQQLLRLDEEDSSPLPETVIQQLIAVACAQVRTSDVICIEDYEKGAVTDAVVRAIVAEARRFHRPVLVDPARLADYRRYHGVDVLTPNREELSIASRRTFRDLADLADAARALVESLDLRAVIATVDREGAVLVARNQEWIHVPTVPRTVYDNTGAGDAVLAMLAACVAAGADWESATRLANVAGGLEVEKFGCVPISADEVLADLRLADRRDGSKLRGLDELVAELAVRRDRGESIAFTNGCFDILHAGHVEFLKRCRREAAALVVGLNGDASVRAQGKGDNRPINSFADRAAVLGAMECVDYVVGFDDPDPERLIRTLRPDVLIKGEDWSHKGVIGRDIVEAAGGRVVLVPLLEGRSTSRIIERIRMGAAKTG
jgi:D-beta-D-heptose 7-phosphate kinase/D-beta-D-heptose 1-phosphate adenosyltransferase